MNDNELVLIASKMVDKAIVFKRENGHYPMVGTALITKDNSVFTGFNVELYGYKGYHAEEIAVLSALKAGYKKNDFIAIAIVYSFPGDYPACMYCRQILLDLTNPDLRIISFSIPDNKGSAYVLRDLCPKPYPNFDIRKDNRSNIRIGEVEDGQESKGNTSKVE
jgi:cytidine deaminase